jgi:multidrug efflux pump subunit AcrA (membrane-fusion protein)
MADLNKVEFASMCRTTVGIVNTNIHRGKIIYNKEDKKIDSDNPLNRAFFTKYLIKSEAEKNQPRQTREEIYEEVVHQNTVKAKTRQRVIDRKKGQKAIDWDARKKKADTLLQESRAQKEAVIVQKLAGKLIPIDLVFSVLKIHNDDIFATFQNDAENLASVYCDILAGGDRKKLSEVTQKISEKLDQSILRAKDISTSSIRLAVEEYAETRSRGERK